MTYQKPTSPDRPVALGYCQTGADQGNAIGRGWTGHFHSTEPDAGWWTGISVTQKGFVTFTAADFTADALNATGIAKAAQVTGRANEILAVEVRDPNHLPAVAAAVPTSVSAYVKRTVAPAHDFWSRDWHWKRNVGFTSNDSFRFDLETGTISHLNTWMRETTTRRFAVYCQAKGAVPVRKTGAVGNTLMRPTINDMLNQIWYAHVSRAELIVLDGWIDSDGQDWESKTGTAGVTEHISHLVAAYNSYKDGSVPNSIASWTNDYVGIVT